MLCSKAKRVLITCDLTVCGLNLNVLIPTSVSQEAGTTGVVADTSHLLKWGTVLLVLPATIPRVQFP